MKRDLSRLSYLKLRVMAGDRLDLALSQVQDGAPNGALETAREAVAVLEYMTQKYNNLGKVMSIA